MPEDQGQKEKILHYSINKKIVICKGKSGQICI